MPLRRLFYFIGNTFLLHKSTAMQPHPKIFCDRNNLPMDVKTNSRDRKWERVRACAAQTTHADCFLRQKGREDGAEKGTGVKGEAGFREGLL